ncbi:hypothetical protein F383_35626 [Gossypium arboreum]|uniref:Uncharacterized protein n=1 Tax=Gossypium arboreum TaxID=29729 RepID=A0A0B0N6I7_GOSAR|nr:hypothetical protein F383_35626 [Gossypium arboreum]
MKFSIDQNLRFLAHKMERETSQISPCGATITNSQNMNLRVN